MKGISGPIEFKEGRRIQFKLDLLKLKQHSLVKVCCVTYRTKQGEERIEINVNNRNIIHI